MLERRKREVELVEAAYGALDLSPALDWLVVRRWPLAAGWNKRETAVLVLIPTGYPVTPPDNLYTDADLCLADGRAPGNAEGFIDHNGRRWRQFSYHVEPADWQPHADPLQGHNLLTFLAGARQRLSEAS